MKIKKKRFGKYLKKLRMSQKACSERLGIGKTLVNYYCVHGIHTTRIARKCAAVLHCRPEDILELD